MVKCAPVIVPRAPHTKPDAAWLESDLGQLGFAIVWTSGPDPVTDQLVRVLARRRGVDGTWESFDRWCGWPKATPAEIARSIERFGEDARAVLDAPPAAELWRELRRFIGAGPLVVPDAASFHTWRAHFESAETPAPLLLGLTDVAALLFPGRLAQRRDALLGALVEPTQGAGPEAFGPDDLALATHELARRFLERDEDSLRLCVLALQRVWERFGVEDRCARHTLNLALSLVEQRDVWFEDAAPASARLGRRLQLLCASSPPLEDLIEVLRPGCAREMERWRTLEILPPDLDEPAPFASDDHALLDQLFKRHIPELFAAAGDSGVYRESQHAVARAVARTLGVRELLLVHAPTGTGKTLAYLVPALLWARRHGVRVGIATYTRALQEQALDRDVPRALAALGRAGIAPGTRVSVLKGRENYLCWRALRAAAPEEDDDAATWLAWEQLCVFALTDIEGDLDRLPLGAPLALADRDAYSRALSAFVRGARAQTGCCTQRDDRDTCAADVARARAQRSHVVIVNHAFALARQEFFRHLVFDECEHLHEQAHSAWSHDVSFRDMRGLLARLSHPELERSRALLDRFERQLLAGTPAHACVGACLEAWNDADTALESLEDAAIEFDGWRAEQSRSREARDDHSLLREYVQTEGQTLLVDARKNFTEHWSRLEVALAELAERLDGLPLRGLPRARRNLDEIRTQLSTTLAAVHAWLPLDEGKPAFRPRTFYDVDRDARGNLALASRVLLPNEFLGSSYYPLLSSGVFLSATTFLQGGFEAAQAYLGLDRAAAPGPNETRPPCVVRTFRAPEVFDYSRVLVAVPRDAPPAQGDKDAFLDYVRRFIAHLAERTRGRMLVLFTNAQDTQRVGEELQGFLRARSIPLWFQNMQGSVKEELSELFRARVDSVLLGVDTFWYGADFPGETLEYLVIVKLPYGVPDRYHHAQCAALGIGEQRRRIYLPRALSKFRQGFGRLMRREGDRGCVFVLDARVLEPRHRFFLKELPIERPFEPAQGASGRDELAPERRARFVRGDTDLCVREALRHMGLLDGLKERGFAANFADSAPRRAHTALVAGRDAPEAEAQLDFDAPRVDLGDRDDDDGAPPRAAATSSPPAPASTRESEDTHPTDAAARQRARRDAEHPLDIPFEDLPY